MESVDGQTVRLERARWKVTKETDVHLLKVSADSIGLSDWGTLHYLEPLLGDLRHMGLRAWSWVGSALASINLHAHVSRIGTARSHPDMLSAFWNGEVDLHIRRIGHIVHRIQRWASSGTGEVYRQPCVSHVRRRHDRIDL